MSHDGPEAQGARPVRGARRPIQDALPIDTARALVLADVVPVTRVERVTLTDACGRVAASDIVSAIDVPPFDRAAMDGYAVIAADTRGATNDDPRTLTRVDTVYTGDTPRRAITQGQCADIATGAPMPEGADAVVMVEHTEAEHTERDGNLVKVFVPVEPGQHVGRRGADIGQGATVVARGAHLSPARVGALAATGIADVDVFEKPRVAILSTGNEVVDPGTPLLPGRIYDINRFTLDAIVRTHGGEPFALPTAPDSLEELTATLADAVAQADLVVFSGGSSVGERDLILDVLRARGEIVFHGLAVKPGKPTAFARVDGKPVLGMPGYPTSCLSNAYILLVPLLRRMAQLPDWQPRTRRLPLARRIVSTTGRHQFYTVRVADGRAEPAFKASGDITSMAAADGYIEIPADTNSIDADTLVDVTLF